MDPDQMKKSPALESFKESARGQGGPGYRWWRAAHVSRSVVKTVSALNQSIQERHLTKRTEGIDKDYATRTWIVEVIDTAVRYASEVSVV